MRRTQATPHLDSVDPGFALGLPISEKSPEDSSSGRRSLESKNRFFPRIGKKWVLITQVMSFEQQYSENKPILLHQNIYLNRGKRFENTCI